MELRKAVRTAPWLPFLAVVLFSSLYGRFLFQHGWHHERIRNTDLPSFHLAARLAFTQGRSPYDLAEFQRNDRRYGQHVFPYLYPPPSLFWFFPLSLTRYRPAAAGFLVIQHLLLPLWLVFAVRFASPRAGGAMPWLLAAGLVTSYPVANTFQHGQVNLLAGVLGLASARAYRRGRPVLTALPLAGAILLKQSLVVLLGLLILRRRWHALAATVGTLALVTLPSAVLVPAGAWPDWLREVRPTLGYGQTPFGLFAPSCSLNQSLNGVVSRFYLTADCRTNSVVPFSGRLLTTVLAVLLAAVTAWTVARRTERGAVDADRDFACVLLVGFLVSPLSWMHHLVLVLPAVALVMCETAANSERWRALVLGVLALGLAVDVPIGSWAGVSPLLGALPAIAVLVFWGALLRSPPDSVGPERLSASLCRSPSPGNAGAAPP